MWNLGGAILNGFWILGYKEWPSSRKVMVDSCLIELLPLSLFFFLSFHDSLFSFLPFTLVFLFPLHFSPPLSSLHVSSSISPIPICSCLFCLCYLSQLPFFLSSFLPSFQTPIHMFILHVFLSSLLEHLLDTIMRQMACSILGILK